MHVAGGILAAAMALSLAMLWFAGHPHDGTPRPIDKLRARLQPPRGRPAEQPVNRADTTDTAAQSNQPLT